MPLESNGEDELDLVTVYRSMDADAQEDAECIQELLTDEGIQAVLLDDSALHQLLGPIHKTPYDEGLRLSLEAARQAS